jgi:DNA-binding NtrC family response regulator
MENWAEKLPIGTRLYDVETAFILATLRHLGGNRTQTCRVLGISIRSLRMRLNRMAEEGLTIPAPPAPVYWGWKKALN